MPLAGALSRAATGAMGSWSIERKLSVGAIVAVLLQCVVLLYTSTWWAATLQSEVAANTAWRIANGEVVVRLDERMAGLSRELSRLSTQLDEFVRALRQSR